MVADTTPDPHVPEERLLALSDGALDPAAADAVAAHVARCPACAALQAEVLALAAFGRGLVETIDRAEPATWREAPRLHPGVAHARGPVPPPAVERAPSSSWLRRAAAVVALIAASTGAAAAARWLSRAPTAPAAPDRGVAAVAAPRRATAGSTTLILTPRGGLRSVVVVDAARGTRCSLRVDSTATEARVTVTGVAAPRFRPDAAGITVSLGGAVGAVTVVVPMAAGATRLVVNGRVVVPGDARPRAVDVVVAW